MPPFATELAAARTAQDAWKGVAVGDRLRFVGALRALLVERADDICAAIHSDIARPPVEVIGSELLPTAAALKFLEKRAAKLLAPRRVSWWDQPTWLMGCRDAVHRRPWGVVGIIGTWNYPIYLNVVQIAQAFVAGNAVLWKPSENAARTAELTSALVRAAGFPAELLQMLPATREAGPQLIEAEVDHVVFTGSDATGRKLAARLGERLVPSTLELSGCDAMFVLADANPELAARAAWFGLTLNRGQTCIAVRRIFVQRQQYAAFIVALACVVRAEPLGLVSAGQQAQAERLIEDATKRGATIHPARPTPQPPPCREGEEESLTSPLEGEVGEALRAGWGGSSADAVTPPPPPATSKATRRPPPPGGRSKASSPLPAGRGVGGVGCPPTFLLNAPPEAAICREACFAPVAAVIPFDAIDDAVRVAKQSPFGLAASIFTADTAKAKELAALIPAGHVCVNDVLAPTAHPAIPFGGRGASGWGVTQGAEGLLAMTVPQAVTVRAGRFRPHFDEAANPDPATVELLYGLLRWTHARGVRAKLRGLWQMVRGVRHKAPRQPTAHTPPRSSGTSPAPF